MIWLILAFVVSGAVSGYLAGLFGIGGGILRIPIFVTLFTAFGTDQAVVMHVSTGTSLALVIPSAVMASYRQRKMGKLNVYYYKTWAIGLLLGSVVGVIIVLYLSTRELEWIFGAFLVIVAIYVGLFADQFTLADAPPKGIIKGVTSSVIGCLSILVGIGGGVFTTPTMKACKVPLRNAIALATATGLVIGIVGGVGAIIDGLGVPGRPMYAWGFVDRLTWVCMAPLIMVTAPLGAYTANKIPKKALKISYAIFLLLMAVYMQIYACTHP